MSITQVDSRFPFNEAIFQTQEPWSQMSLIECQDKQLPETSFSTGKAYLQANSDQDSLEKAVEMPKETPSEKTDELKEASAIIRDDLIEEEVIIRNIPTNTNNDLQSKCLAENIRLSTDDLNEQALLAYIFRGTIKNTQVNRKANWNTLNACVDAHKKLICYLEKHFSEIVVNHLNSLMNLVKENLTNQINLDSRWLVEVMLDGGATSVENTNLYWWYFESFLILLTAIVENLPNDIFDLFITKEIIFAIILRISSNFSSGRIRIEKILKHIYQKSTKNKDCILKDIKNLLLSIIYEGGSESGCAELLNFLLNLIKDQNISDDALHDFANEIFLPLHKVQSVRQFHEQLKSLCLEYSKINNEYANNWISAIVRWWPYGNSNKELLFIDELEVALNFSEAFISEQAANLALSKLTRIVSSFHEEVSLKSLKLLSKQCSKNIISKYSGTLCLKLMKFMIQGDRNLSNNNLKARIHEHVGDFIFNTIPKSKCFEYIRLYIFKESSLTNMHSQKQRAKLEERWEALLKKAKEINPDFTCPEIPYKETCVAGLNNMSKFNLPSSGHIIPSAFVLKRE